MRAVLLRSLVFVLLLIGLALLLDPLFTSIHQHGKGTKAQWLWRMHQRSYDAVILGSSRAWWNIDMQAVDSACGGRSINLANNHFTPAEMLLAMKLFVRNGNGARKVLIQVDHSTLTEEQQGFSSTVYDFVPFLDDSLVYGHLAPRDPEWFWLRHVPFWRYTKYNFKWGIEQAVLSALDRRPVPFDSSGSYFSPNDRFYGKPGLPYTPERHAFGNDLIDLLELCKANGMEPILFTSPYFGLDIPAAAREALPGVARAAGYALHDYTDSIPDMACFNDNKHLNRVGGTRFTRMLARDLICPAMR